MPMRTLGLLIIVLLGALHAYKLVRQTYVASHIHSNALSHDMAKQYYQHRLALGSLSSTSNLGGDGEREREVSLIPSPVALKASNIEIVRFLGKIDIIQPDAEPSPPLRQTTIRVFEARVAATQQGLPATEGLSARCFLKEYLPAGESFGRRELSTSRKLLNQWNSLQMQREEEEGSDGSRGQESVPFPILLGSLRTDERIENADFKARWLQRFPRTRPPDAGNLWIIYRWDEASFKTLRSFPALPQLVEGLDYFNKKERVRKRWAYVRQVMRRGLESLDFLHRTGSCHNALSSDSLWLSSTNQLDAARLDVRLTDLGASQRLADLGPYARGGVMEDYYQLGLVYLEFIVDCFMEEDTGAEEARIRYLGHDGAGAGAGAGAGSKSDPSMTLRGAADSLTLGLSSLLSRLGTPRGQGFRTGPLKQNEWQRLFEGACDSDFGALRAAVREVCPDAADILERNAGEAWRLLFRLLARGRLVDEEKGRPVTITGRGLLREYRIFFDAL